jgi:hypothetical protein
MLRYEPGHFSLYALCTMSPCYLMHHHCCRQMAHILKTNTPAGPGDAARASTLKTQHFAHPVVVFLPLARAPPPPPQYTQQNSVTAFVIYTSRLFPVW